VNRIRTQVSSVGAQQLNDGFGKIRGKAVSRSVFHLLRSTSTDVENKGWLIVVSQDLRESVRSVGNPHHLIIDT